MKWLIKALHCVLHFALNSDPLHACLGMHQLALVRLEVEMVNNEIRDDHGSEELLGAVRSVRVERARISGDNQSYNEGPSMPVRLTTFDPKGREVEELNLSSDSSAETKNVFIYDAKERLAEKRQYTNERYDGKTVYTYDDRGRLDQEIREAPDGALLIRKVYRYDADGNRVEAAHYQQDGSLTTRILSRFDEDGRTAEVIFCGGPRTGVIIKTDEHIKVLSPDSTPSDHESICGEGIFITRLVFAYNDGGDPISVHQYGGGGSLLNRKVFTKDADGRRFTISHYGPDGELREKEEHRRELDSRGNWIKDTKFIWDANADVFEPAEVTYRKIDYY
ncbi:MAG: hypothetical protein M3362_10300 [Acidobacteriota bacterium]|nr:hypothetical protein [Acidobacteriota bacterium]